MGGRRRRRLRAVVLLALTLLLAGCQLDVELNIVVEDDGSGVVEVAIGVDDDALARRPGLVDELDVDDLVEAGWVVTGPTREADDLTWLRARHPFGRPEELEVLVDEVAGPNGPFRQMRLTREDSFTRTRYRFEGVVDFTAGLDDLTTDPELAEALDAGPRELLEERLGSAVDELVAVRVGVRLPGDVESNAPTRADNGAVWRPSVLEREAIELSATGTLQRTERLIWAGVAALATVALVLFVSIRLVLWQRGRR